MDDLELLEPLEDELDIRDSLKILNDKNSEFLDLEEVKNTT
jgi:hypothetical protein